MTASQLSPEYFAYIGSSAWAAKRREFFASPRTPKRCQGCNAARPLDLHHRTYVRFTHELLSDLVPVCRSCHDQIHDGFDSRKGDLPKHTAAVLARLRAQNGLPALRGSDARRKQQSTRTRLSTEEIVRQVTCPTCQAAIGQQCIEHGRHPKPRPKSHTARVKAAKRVGSWEAKHPRPKHQGKDPVNKALSAQDVPTAMAATKRGQLHPAVAAALERRRLAERRRNGL